jgi:ABC-2 type transport system ATP-binding protein
LIVTIDSPLNKVPNELTKFNVELIKNNKLVFRVTPTKVPVESVINAVRAAGLKIIDLTTKESDLEDIFLLMTSNNGTEKKFSSKP